jgi:heat shock protein HtpX
MYIINPFRKKGFRASEFTSTHPPISERIRILRAMAGASFNDYDQAFRQLHRGGSGVIPAASLAAAAVPIATVKLEGEAGELNEIQRARETSDVMWRLSNYRTIACDCGAKLRVPPTFKEPQIKCPRCGRTHQV